MTLPPRSHTTQVTSLARKSVWAPSDAWPSNRPTSTRLPSASVALNTSASRDFMYGVFITAPDGTGHGRARGGTNAAAAGAAACPGVRPGSRRCCAGRGTGCGGRTPARNGGPSQLTGPELSPHGAVLDAGQQRDRLRPTGPQPGAEVVLDADVVAVPARGQLGDGSQQPLGSGDDLDQLVRRDRYGDGVSAHWVTSPRVRARMAAFAVIVCLAPMFQSATSSTGQASFQS